MHRVAESYRASFFNSVAQFCLLISCMRVLHTMADIVKVFFPRKASKQHRTMPPPGLPNGDELACARGSQPLGGSAIQDEFS